MVCKALIFERVVAMLVTIQGVSKILGKTSGVNSPHKNKEYRSYPYTSANI